MKITNYGLELHYCNGKMCYDKRGALTVKNEIRKERGIELRAYQCPDCNGWHLSKSLNTKPFRKMKRQEKIKYQSSFDF